MQIKKENIVLLPLTKIKPYKKNAKKHPKEQVERIANSIKRFGFTIPILVDGNNIVIAGHGRCLAAKMLGIKEVPCLVKETWTEEEVKAYRLIDNKVNESEWDEKLIDEELESILEINMFDFGFDTELTLDEKYSEGVVGSLEKSFLAPPFSVLDAKQKYWIDRKQMWNDILGDTTEGRTARSFSKDLGRMGFGNSISTFDPVLCEILYRWFCPDNGAVIDCFAGGCTRGIVAQKTGHKYLGIDLSTVQIDANIERAKSIGVTHGIKWVNDDSLNVDKYAKDETFDMLLTCPPYFNLEKYSDDKRDISNMNEDNFCKVYENILLKTIKKVKNNRFVIVVVGNVRRKDGSYFDLIEVTKRIANKANLLLYNDVVLLDRIGTAGFRARQSFVKARKLVKVHQNVLVFYKGDLTQIKKEFSELSGYVE